MKFEEIMEIERTWKREGGVLLQGTLCIGTAEAIRLTVWFSYTRKCLKQESFDILSALSATAEVKPLDRIDKREGKGK